jgi:hypothetical protein
MISTVNSYDNRRERNMSDVRPTTAAFSVRGMRNGSPVVIGWDHGVLSGDPPTIDLIEVEAELAFAGRGDALVQRTFDHGAADDRETLADPLAALAVIRRVIDRVTEVAVRDVGPAAPNGAGS